MPHLWKSLRSGDFHELLGKIPQKAAGFSHISHRPLFEYFYLSVFD
jgi:hypothetical protein